MTNEEVIYQLKEINKEAHIYSDAVDMAIEALKEQSKHDQNTSSKQPDSETLCVKTGETCADAISRQAAFDAKQEFRNPNVVRNTEARTAYDRTYANGWNDCNLAWINAIKALPSVQPEPRWISCNDRLPDKDGDYLVYYDEGYREDYGFDEIGIAPFEVDCEGFGIWQEKFDHWTLGSLGSDWVEIKVVAWMPLPEPYQAERREERRKSDVKST